MGGRTRAHESRRRLALSNSSSCNCVNLGWTVPFEALSGQMPRGEIARSSFGGECWAGLQTECAAGGGLHGAPECNVTTLETLLARVYTFTFWPSADFVAWLVSTAEECQPYQFFKAEPVALFLEAPVLPPMVWDPDSVASFMLIYAWVIGLPNTAYEPFIANWITGSQWASFEAADYEKLGFSIGEAYAANLRFKSYLSNFSQAGEYDPFIDAQTRLGPTLIYPQVILERLVDVNAPNYFEIEYFVNFAWEDRRIFTRCKSVTDEQMDPTDPCSIYWQPRVLLPDALGNDDEPQLVQDLGLTTHVGQEMSSVLEQALPGLERSIAYKQFRQRAKFLIVLDYNALPFDRHSLNFTMRLPPTDTADKACFTTGERNSTVVELPSLQLGADWANGDKPAIWRGWASQVRQSARPANQLWDIVDFTAHAEAVYTDPLLSLESTEWTYANNPAFVLRGNLMSDSPQLVEEFRSNGEYQVCQVTFSISIERRNIYHIFNYIIMQVVLVVLSWCTFFIDPSSLDARLGISLTLLLAINVFQIVLVDKMPETGSLSRLQWFTIMNTLVLGLMALESIVVCSCWKWRLVQIELDRRLKEVTNKKAAEWAVQRLQRAYRRIKLRRLRQRFMDKHPSREWISPRPQKRRISVGPVEGAQAARESLGSHSDLEFGDVALLALTFSEPADRWYLFKKRMHRRRLRLVSAIAVYGDQVSMCIIFPALLAIVFALSFGS